ncbi:MAG: fumarylacetoacetate hydrolase family protein [Gammaproteobacteria bacterium]|nr:fumarylacetoacetate hydrolase family protein [Pseudomonadales bacterium]MCP5346857.1 fumarylacetoacetate hydrolase family protein [Pseudomonadales bacterium]
MKHFVSRIAVGAAALLFVAGVNAQAQTFVRYSQDGGEIHWGMVHDDGIYELAGAPYNTMEHTGTIVQREDVRLEAPVDPSLVFMTAFNFRSHIRGEPAPYPGLFIIPANSIIGPEDPIVRPAESTNLHYEAEMAIIVGKHAENVPVEEAADYIFGVTAGNDVSERAWQAGDIQWVRAKGTRGFNAVGPALIKGADYKNTQITGRLNGEVVQGENSSDLIFGMEEMLSYISQYFTLEPGDMIWSGTMGSTRAMVPGDVYEVELSGIGTLRNEVVQGK